MALRAVRASVQRTIAAAPSFRERLPPLKIAGYVIVGRRGPERVARAPFLADPVFSGRRAGSSDFAGKGADCAPGFFRRWGSAKGLALLLDVFGGFTVEYNGVQMLDCFGRGFFYFLLIYLFIFVCQRTIYNMSIIL